MASPSPDRGIDQSWILVSRYESPTRDQVERWFEVLRVTPPDRRERLIREVRSASIEPSSQRDQAALGKSLVDKAVGQLYAYRYPVTVAPAGNPSDTKSWVLVKFGITDWRGEHPPNVRQRTINEELHYLVSCHPSQWFSEEIPSAHDDVKKFKKMEAIEFIQHVQQNCAADERQPQSSMESLFMYLGEGATNVGAEKDLPVTISNLSLNEIDVCKDHGGHVTLAVEQAVCQDVVRGRSHDAALMIDTTLTRSEFFKAFFLGSTDIGYTDKSIGATEISILHATDFRRVQRDWHNRLMDTTTFEGIRDHLQRIFDISPIREPPFTGVSEFIISLPGKANEKSSFKVRLKPVRE